MYSAGVYHSHSPVLWVLQCGRMTVGSPSSPAIGSRSSVKPIGCSCPSSPSPCDASCRSRWRRWRRARWPRRAPVACRSSSAAKGRDRAAADEPPLVDLDVFELTATHQLIELGSAEARYAHSLSYRDILARSSIRFALSVGSAPRESLPFCGPWRRTSAPGASSSSHRSGMITPRPLTWPVVTDRSRNVIANMGV